LRISASTRREAFDADLQYLHARAGRQLAVWAASLDPHQSKTDILGALDAAPQEIALLPRETQRFGSTMVSTNGRIMVVHNEQPLRAPQSR